MPRRDLPDRMPFANRPEVHPDAPAGGGGAGHFDHPRNPGALGRDPFRDPTLLAQHVSGKKTKGRSKQSRAKKKKESKVDELNLWADFKSEWAGVKNSEVFEASQSPGAWYPGSTELKEFASSGHGKVQGVADVNGLLATIGDIGRRKPGSLKRVNLFTHGSPGYIALRGTVTRGQKVDGRWTHGEVYFEEELDGDRIDQIEAGNWTLSLGKIKGVTVDDVRAAFAPNAVMVIYACNGGTDQEYLSRLSKAFGIKVQGFRKTVEFVVTPTSSGKSIRTRYRVSGETTTVSDFHKLTPHVTVDPKKNKKK